MRAPPLIGVSGRHEEHVPGNGHGRAQTLAGRTTPLRAELIHDLPSIRDVPAVNDGYSRSLSVCRLEHDDIIADHLDGTSVAALGGEGIENDRREQDRKEDRAGHHGHTIYPIPGQTL